MTDLNQIKQDAEDAVVTARAAASANPGQWAFVAVVLAVAAIVLAFCH